MFIDNNLPHTLKACFEGLVIHASDIGYANANDRTVWNYCKAENLCILTKDKDFEDLSNFHGHPPKVIKLTCGNIRTKELVELVHLSMNVILTFLDDKNSSLLIIR